MPIPQIPVYVINLDRSPDRWRDAVANVPDGFDRVHRVSGVDGNLVEPEDRSDFDEQLFKQQNGRLVIPGEYGCYMSHIHALQTIAAAPDSHAIVVEDDIQLTAEGLAQVTAIVNSELVFDVIKLVNFRVRLFRQYAEIDGHIRIGRAALGPMGSAAAYLVRRDVAEKLTKSLLPMSLPFDVALERHWATQVNFYTTRTNLFKFGKTQSDSTIVGKEGYGKFKMPGLQRFGAALFRLSDIFSRFQAVLSLRPKG